MTLIFCGIQMLEAKEKSTENVAIILNFFHKPESI